MALEDDCPDGTSARLYCCDGSSPDDIVISGVSGRFPWSDNVEEFGEALYNKKNFFLPTEERWEKGTLGITNTKAANLKDLSRFDAEFFAVPGVLAESAEPDQRILLEVCYEAICDSGYDPRLLRHRPIGVYCASSNSDAKELSIREQRQFDVYGIPSMRANRCSYYFDFTGPSYCIDSACSSSIAALNLAVKDIRDGRCEAALVSGTQLNMNPELALTYSCTGLQSKDTISAPFDESANGIVRSEAVVAIFVQKASQARRNYCKILSIATRSAGYTTNGISVPSVLAEVSLFKEVLEQGNIDPQDILYVEAHGTGTPVGDPVEIEAVSQVFCVNREEPLLLGSVKSHIGHAEASSGLCSIVKMILAFETGLIAPNVNFSKPMASCTAIVDGKIKVLTETTPLPSNLIALNCFGIGGTNCQGIFSRNELARSCETFDNALPELVLYSATTQEAVRYALDYVTNRTMKREFFSLLNQIAYSPVLFKPYRGFSVVTPEPVSEIQRCEPGEREVWFVLTGMGCQWPGMGLDLMEIDIFARSIHRSANVLAPFGIDLLEYMKPESDHLLQNRKITPAFVTICAIQIALIDVLNALGIVPDGIVGHSTGELVCAYADGCCTAEETILSAYWRGQAVELSNLPEGAMAAVGMTWEEVKALCPEHVHLACHNAQDSVTISGLVKPVEAFVAQLKKENRFARIVNAYGFAFHCPTISKAEHMLKTMLDQVILHPKVKTKRWLSTSYPPESWDKPEANIADASYFVHNLLSTVRFAEALAHVPTNAITIEIGPHFLLQALLKRVIGTRASYLGTMKKHEKNVNFFLSTIGKLYTLGLNPQIDVLYPPTKFPVPRGTAMISNLIKWNHSRKWFVSRWSKPNHGSVTTIIDPHADDHYILDHCIDGRSLFPATGYIALVWEALARLQNKPFDELPIVVEDFRIHRATLLSQTEPTTFNVSILNVGGDFEIVEGISVVATGRIAASSDPALTGAVPIYSGGDHLHVIGGKELYGELRINGYEYGPSFQMLIEANIDGTTGLIKFPDKWIPYLDSHLLFFGLLQASHKFYLPTGALMVKIDPLKLQSCMKERQKQGLDGMPVVYNDYTKCCRSPGVEIQKLKLDAASHSTLVRYPVLEKIHFVPYEEPYSISREIKRNCVEYAEVCSELAKQIFTPTRQQGSRMLKEPEEISSKVNSYLQRYGDKCTLLNTLLDLSKLANTESYAKTVKNIFGRHVENINQDLLYQTLFNEYPLKHVLETVAENSASLLKLTEIANGSFVLLPSAENYMKLNSKLKLTLVHPKPEILGNDVLNEKHVDVIKDKLSYSIGKLKEQDLVLSSFLFGDVESFRSHLRVLKSIIHSRGFILLFHRERLVPAETFLCSLCDEVLQTVSEVNAAKTLKEENLVVVSRKSDSLGSTLYLLRFKGSSRPYSDSVVHVQDGNYSQWVNDLRNSLTRANGNNDERIWVVANDTPFNGIIGMIKCLNKEPDGDKIRCVFMVPDQSKRPIKAFDLNEDFFAEIAERDLLMNVYKDCSWGAYRGTTITTDLKKKPADYSYLNCMKYGDLSSFQWMESRVGYDIGIDEKESLVHVCYSGLNFRDVMMATGKMNVGFMKELIGNDPCVLGLEFSGVDPKGRRLMGLVSSRAMATAVLSELVFSAEVPDCWTLEEAATVPVVYYTCYYALMVRGGLSIGETILIHSAAGGIGIAAIRIALSLKCKIFVTVGSKEKRHYLKKNFPEIEEQHIGYSRDTSFENLVMEQTQGKGVQVILNSLADDKLLASTRCLADHGRFIEIGKYDLLMDHKIGLSMFLNNSSFIGISLDKMFIKDEVSRQCAKQVAAYLKKGVRDGVVQPLDRTVFDKYQAEEAFRYMATGKHIGKVVLKIRDEPRKGTVPAPLKLEVTPCTYFYKNKSYVVIGGLGGFGIELTKWLLENGARHVVLTSRYGIRTPYHQLCMRRWREEGVNVQVSLLNVAKRDEAKQLLEEVSKTAPIGGIFNSAVVLKDGFMDKQTPDIFDEVCSPKAAATKHLDELSRVLCPALDYFVCFSSISCGKGNAGQSNYGYANSVMERVCEKRRSDGLHGLAIEWGIIGDVGVVHRHMGEDAMIAGVVSQKIKSCLETLSHFLHSVEPVLSSYVVADVSHKKGSKEDFLPQMAKIFGYKDPSEMNLSRSFSEIGIDSMMGVELQQILESKFDIILSLKELHQMKIEDLMQLIQDKGAKPSANPESTNIRATWELIPENLDAQVPVMPLNEKADGLVFVVHYSETELERLRPLMLKLNQRVFGLPCTKDISLDSLSAIADSLLKRVSNLCNGDQPFHIIGYSCAASLAIEMALQSQNCSSTLLLDGTMQLINNMLLVDDVRSDKENQLLDLLHFLKQFTAKDIQEVREQLEAIETFEMQTAFVVDTLSASSNGKFNKAEVTNAMNRFLDFHEKMRKLHVKKKLLSNLHIVEATNKLLPNDVSLVKSTLAKVCQGNILVTRVPGSENFLFEENSISRVAEQLNQVF